jgi:hypothetical protein
MKVYTSLLADVAGFTSVLPGSRLAQVNEPRGVSA